MAIFQSEPGSHMFESKMLLEKIRNELIRFGLTQNQAKIYIFLGKFGPKTAPEVYKSLGLPRTETYYIINTLQNRGIVTAELSSPARYSALSIEKTTALLIDAERERLNFLAKKQEEVCELWNTIPPMAMEPGDGEREKMQMLQGSPQIITKAASMVASAEEEILILGSVKDIARFYHSNILDGLEGTKPSVKIIVSPARAIPEFAEKIERRKIKVMPASKADNQCFIIRDGKEILMFLRNASHPSNDIFAVWSDSRPLIDAMRDLFGYTWKEAEHA